MLPVNIQNKIKKQQHCISTNYDLSKYNYYTDGFRNNKIWWVEKEYRLKHVNKYLKSKKGSIKYNHYRNSKKGRIMHQKAFRKCIAKRNRNLNYFEINNYFQNAIGHHVNKDLVLYVPKIIHTSIYHSVLKNTNMIEINSLAFTWYFNESRLESFGERARNDSA